MPKKVLIVSPRFPPVTAPDHQRVRMMLPYLPHHGWTATILAVDPRDVEAPLEANLEASLPSDATIHRVRAIPQWLTRRVRFGSLAIRAYPSLWRHGLRLLRRERFDLVFFSTTEFGVLPIALSWQRRTEGHVKFVVDLQDPWVSDYYERTGKNPPGGAFKHGLTQEFARRNEGPVLRRAAHIISVSPTYVDTLRTRYPDIPQSRFSVIPFGGSRSDFELLLRLRVRQRQFDPADGKLHWLYAGTAPPGIRHAFVSFLRALQRAFDAGIVAAENVRVHFIGTDYAAGAAASERVMPFARELGMDRIVSETPARMPYFETLACLLDASALLVFGWDDPGYTASKLYPYILARKPLLSVFHERSSANDVLRATQAGTLVTFGSAPDIDATTDAIFERWFASGAFHATPRTDWQAFEPFTAEAMTRRVVDVFNHAAGSASGDG